MSSGKLVILLLGVVACLMSLTVGKSLVKPPWIRTSKPNFRKARSVIDKSTSDPICSIKSPVKLNLTTENEVEAISLWTQFYIYPDPKFEQWELNVIKQAVHNIRSVIPCVQFRVYQSYAKPSGDFIRLLKGTSNGCSSYIGRQGGGQNIDLQSPGCINVGTVMLQFLQALGLHHEQRRNCPVVGDTGELQQSDILKLKAIYNC